MHRLLQVFAARPPRAAGASRRNGTELPVCRHRGRVGHDHRSDRGHVHARLRHFPRRNQSAGRFHLFLSVSFQYRGAPDLGWQHRRRERHLPVGQVTAVLLRAHLAAPSPHPYSADSACGGSWSSTPSLRLPWPSRRSFGRRSSATCSHRVAAGRFGARSMYTGIAGLAGVMVSGRLLDMVAYPHNYVFVFGGSARRLPRGVLLRQARPPGRMSCLWEMALRPRHAFARSSAPRRAGASSR